MSDKLPDDVIEDLAELQRVRAELRAAGANAYASHHSPALVLRALLRSQSAADYRDGVLAAISSGCLSANAHARGLEFVDLMNARRIKAANESANV